MDYAKQLLQDIDALDGERWFQRKVNSKTIYHSTGENGEYIRNVLI